MRCRLTTEGKYNILLVIVLTAVFGAFGVLGYFLVGYDMDLFKMNEDIHPFISYVAIGALSVMMAVLAIAIGAVVYIMGKKIIVSSFKYTAKRKK